jgi:pyruvate kinase
MSPSTLKLDVFDCSTLDPSNPQALLDKLQQLRQLVAQEGQEIFDQWRSHIQRQAFLGSGLNLAYYVALRRHDLRRLQAALIPWGLSSLGRLEAHVMPNLDAVIATLEMICQVNSGSLSNRPSVKAFLEGDCLLQQNTEDVFGPVVTPRQVRIMVTLPTIAATDYLFMRDLVERGIDCIRINCAHDTAEVWEAMIANLRRAEMETGRSCKILMDLGGPKARLGSIIAPTDHVEPEWRLFQGDRLLLTRCPPTIAGPAYFQAHCILPEILDQLQVGASVWIDDGRVGACVESCTEEGVLLRITQARSKGEKLRSDKGLNFPDTLLRLYPLTKKDLQDLDFIAKHADIVGYSFVQEAGDIELLQQALQARMGDRSHPLAVIAKIETPTAVSNLPELIVHAAGRQPLGVMIARGDLAVEIGYQRLAEIQEEILWLCEAAHVPVIWATQVLENLVAKGTPSRAEMTDAAMAERAECVMLNKGPYLPEAVTILDDVLTRMQAHQLKKTPQLRALHSW